MSDVFGFAANSLDGTPVSLEQYRGKVLLIVNTASQCGFTPQYKGLETLHRQFKDKGFEVLGFPCNQFGKQEPGDANEISAFCEQNYGVTFPLFAKIDVNGSHAHPLFKYLKKEARGMLRTQSIKWNFTKFLIDRNGKPVKRFAPITKPEAIEPQIRRLLDRSGA